VAGRVVLVLCGQLPFQITGSVDDAGDSVECLGNSNALCRGHNGAKTGLKYLDLGASTAALRCVASFWIVHWVHPQPRDQGSP